jgi:DUF971 family protein
MADTPSAIRALPGQFQHLIGLVGATPVRLPYRHLRANCPCATCRDEWTGERLLDPATIAPDLKLAGMDSVGNYAVRLAWSDGHDSGLYTWDLLRTLSLSAPGAHWTGIDPPPAG